MAKPPINPKNTPNKRQIIAARFEEISSPYPPPQMLQEFDKIMPGSAEKVLNTALQSIDRTLAMQEKGQMSAIEYDRRAQWFSGLILVGVIISGILLILNGKEVTGLITVLGSVVTVAGSMITDRVLQKKGK